MYRGIQDRGDLKEPLTLGDHLQRRRLELGLYQKDFAAKIGVTPSTVWNWEHGWTIDKRFISRVFTFLGYSPDNCCIGRDANS
jgi:transcriptional regulator with XRE-family HTH domain